MSNALHTSDQSHDASVAKVAELISGTKVCMFTTTDADGRLVSRPMAVIEAAFDGELWFVTDGSARKVGQVSQLAEVNVAFASSGSWVSVTGDARIVRDAAKAKDLWGPGVDAWFPEGPESPKIVLVNVRADSAEYWDTPGGAISSFVLSFVKSRVTGEPYKVENDTVSL